jgi:hypothetical protein
MSCEHEDMHTYVYKCKYLMYKTSKKSGGLYRTLLGISVYKTDAS